jgi:hypothetical protein
MVFLVLNFIFLSALSGLILYGMQINDQRHKDTEALTNAIHESDLAAGNNTDRLVKQTIDASDRNYQLLQQRANVSNGVFSIILHKLQNASIDLTTQHTALLQKLSPNSTIIARQIQMAQEVHEIRDMIGNMSR